MSRITDLNPSALEKREMKEAIAWLRPDPRQRLYPAWTLGVTLVLVGCGCCGLFFHQAIPDAVALLLIGLGAVLSGMLTMVISALKVLSDNTCLLWTAKSVIYRDQNARRTELPWDEINEIRCEPSLEYLELSSRLGFLKVHLTSMRLDPTQLCKILIEERRRALMGLPLRDAQSLRALNIPVSAPRHIL